MKSFVGIVAMMVFSIAANAEEVKHGEGDKTLNFNFNGLELSRDNYGVGGKIWTSEKNVFTASFNINKNERQSEFRDSFSTNTVDDDVRSYGLSFGWESHFGKSTLVSPYYGTEIGYAFLQDKSQFGTNSRSGHQWSVNISALLGVEYFVDAAISLAAEYSFSYRYSKYKTSTENRFDETTTKRFGFGAGSLKLMVYF